MQLYESPLILHQLRTRWNVLNLALHERQFLIFLRKHLHEHLSPGKSWANPKPKPKQLGLDKSWAAQVSEQ